MTLNGCTLLLWGQHNPFSESTTHHEITQDEIQAFGVVKQANSQFARGSLVMMGKENWFVVNPQDSAKLQGILDVKLDKAFQIVNSYNHQLLKSFPIDLKAAESNDFSTKFCLRYDTDKAADIAKLKALAFETKQPSKSAANQTPYYVRCEHVAGKFYQSPPTYRSDYRFETPFPVTVYHTVTKKHTDKVQLLLNITSTPIAVAADAALAVASLALLPVFLVAKKLGNRISFLF